MAMAISQEKINAAFAACVARPELADYYRNASDAAKKYVALRFFASVYRDKPSRMTYRYHRAAVGKGLSRADVEYLLAHESDPEEARFLQGLLAPQAAAPRARARRPSGGGSGIGCVFGLLLLAGLGAGIYFFGKDRGWFAEKKPIVPPKMFQAVTNQPPPLAAAPKPSDAPKKLLLTNDLEEPPPMVIPLEATNAVKTVDPAKVKAQEEAIATARKDAAKTKNGFAGIAFGSAAEGYPLAREAVYAGDDVAACGFAYAVEGPELKAMLPGFKTKPRLWVTPKTRRVFRIEFDWAGVLSVTNAEEKADGVAALLQERFKVEPFDLLQPRRGFWRQRVFQLGETAFSVDEGHGRTLSLSIEHEKYRAEAKAETAEVCAAAAADLGGDRVLDSDAYPNAGIARTPGVKAVPGTPKAFCGIAFRGIPLPGTLRENRRKGTQYVCLDYRGKKCRPFKGFDCGRAEVTPKYGCVCAVDLHSAGGPDGLDDAEYLENVKRTIARHYQLEPQKAEEDWLWTIGDLEIRLGADVNGGFRLRAAHRGLVAAK